MSSGYGRNGGSGPPGGGGNRKRNKKYGLNLYQLQKAAPAAPPVPTIITNAPSTKNSKPSHGLLLLSKKNPSGGGLLAEKGTGTADGGKQTANDAMFAKAQGDAADGQGGGTHEAKPKTPVAAWGNKGEKQQPKQESVELSLEELSLKPPATNHTKEEEPSLTYDENTSLLVLAPKGSLSKQKPALAANEPASDAESNKQKNISTPDEPKQKDEQQQYMSKLAKERAQRLKSEEEARTAQQKERAAKRLKELEAKRLEQKKEKERQQKSKKKQSRFDGPPTSIIIGKEASKKPPSVSVANVPSKIYSRKEVSQPKIVLEPLGKPKKIMTHSDNPSADNGKTAECQKEGNKKLYDPNRPYSSLVGGKTKPKSNEAISSGSVMSGKSEESSAAKSKSSRGKGPAAVKPPAKKEESPSAVKMVTLSSFEDRDRGVGRGAAGGRMLFDPTSGSLVAASPGEVQQQQLSPVGGGMKSKQQFPKPPTGTAKATDGKQKQLKKSDGKSRTKKTRARFPRTRGVQYKKDERGNYVNADECEADCGYGQHSVPGGRVRNQAAYAKISEQSELHHSAKPSKKLNADAPSFFGFQIQKDSTQQTDFEAQQQRILEDAWASLEEAAPSHEEEHPDEAESIEPQAGNRSSQGDEYAAALAISPTMIGLGSDKEEPFDISKFALEGASAGLPSNRFGSLGGGESRLLGSTTWGASTPANNNGATLGEIAGLSGWNFDPNATDFTPSGNNSTAASNTITNESEQSSNSNTFINLNGWGSTGFDSFAFGGNHNNHSKESG